MTKDAMPATQRSWVERNLSALMICIFGTAISALMVVMTGSIKDLRTDLASIDSSLTTLQIEMVSTRVTIADEVALLGDEVALLGDEVALIDDEIIRSIGDLRADFSIANQHLTGIDTHLSLLKREYQTPADFSLATEIEFTADESSQQRDK